MIPELASLKNGVARAILLDDLSTLKRNPSGKVKFYDL